MKKKILKVLLWILSLFALLIIAFSSILYLNKDKVQAAILDALKENLEVPLEFDEAEISLKKFPKASLKFNSIFSPGLKNNISDTLIAAEEVFFLFDIWDIIQGNLIVEEIDIENADINILQLKKGYNNFTIWKKENSSDNQLFTLSQIKLLDVNFRFFNEDDNIDLELDIKKNTLSGRFSKTILDIKSNGNFKINKLLSNSFSLTKPLEIKTIISLNSKEKDSLEFKGEALLLNSEFKFEGLNQKDEFFINVSTEDLALQLVNSFLLEQQILDEQDWNISGSSTCNFTYGSKLSAKPTFSLEFSTKDSQLSNLNGFKINELQLVGNYVQNENSDHLHIESFSGQSPEGDITGNLSIKNFSNPFLKLNLNSTLTLSEWLKINPVDTISKANGKVRMVLSLENQFKSFKKISAKDLKNVKTKGSISLEACEIQFKGWEDQIEKLNGDLIFNNKQIDINRLFFQFKESDIYLDGSFANVVNYLALENEKLKVNCKLTSQNIQLEDLIKNSSDSKKPYNLNFTDNILLDLDVDVQQFKMKKFSASNIKGNLKIEKGIISIQKLQLNADDGEYTGKLAIDTRSHEKYFVDAQLNFNGIDIHKLFESFEDFGQEAIKSENILGIAEGNALFKAQMSPNLEIDPSSIAMESDIKISDGHIKDYEPMLALSKYSDIEDLKDVYFHSLENHISIQNSVIHIPAMSIESNILNLQINGSHGFDNVVDYRIKLKASDALFNKRKKNTKPSEFDEHLQLNDRKDDHFIFIKMFGPLDKIKIELDNKSLGKSINQDFKNQKNELKGIFKKEKEDKKTDDPGIIYDWDDEDDG